MSSPARPYSVLQRHQLATYFGLAPPASGVPTVTASTGGRYTRGSIAVHIGVRVTEGQRQLKL